MDDSISIAMTVPVSMVVMVVDNLAGMPSDDSVQMDNDMVVVVV